MNAGRSCPLSYRYSPTVFKADASVSTEVLYVVGGLYGNEPALNAVIQAFEKERLPKHLIFNGDFNWFNVAPDSFCRINETVLSLDAIRGNVETELMPDDPVNAGAGCGCAYPDWVDDAVVQRSNQIMQRLVTAAAQFPELRLRLTHLPMWKRIDVGGVPIGVVHGDAQSLAGWGFAVEHLRQEAHAEEVRRWFDESGVRVFACTHTCSTVFHPLINARGEARLVANNGAAGMPNFSGVLQGMLTRIGTTPYSGGPVHCRTRIGGLYVEAVPILYDRARWQKEFLMQWPMGSAAHQSYWRRISAGPSYRLEQAFKGAHDAESSMEWRSDCRSAG